VDAGFRRYDDQVGAIGQVLSARQALSARFLSSSAKIPASLGFAIDK
jgi:hypothetical protein